MILVNLDGNYINPDHIRGLSERNNHYGKTITLLSFNTTDDSEAIIRLDMSLEDALEKLQKAEKVKIIR
ncbi:hypothetical protein [Streptococcus thoraltensis]|uniref:hypothetical protein n=1 Tax=Streptococcus thoraltensis TaxID=55085 RepID=UPI00035EC190|nr:hypothetical protein [Streptococcus thoraltensis]QBX31131.1 hypothetical protein Javan616_0038 [Streptococcus phage Javan616]